MRRIPPLEQGMFYHIYARGTNGENIFREDRNYEYFLKKWEIYIPAVADTFVYSLLTYDFHALVRIKTGELKFKNKIGIIYNAVPERQFSHMLNGYAQGFNKTYQRTGSLFEHPFKREPIFQHQKLIDTVANILFCPQKFAFTADFRQYPFSSYHKMIGDEKSFIQKENVYEWFGGKEKLIAFLSNYENRII